jgi:hypothetical protein
MESLTTWKPTITKLGWDGVRIIFTKLKGTNYATWADHMQSTLQAKYLWLIVKGTETCPPAPPATRPTMTTAAEYKAECKEHLDWLLRDEAAQGIMKSACDSSQFPHVKDCTSAKDMWNTLKKIHVTNHARINVHYYFEELYTRKYVDGMPMADHITAILDLKSQIQDAGETLDDTHAACAMVLSLPKTQSWDVVVNSVLLPSIALNCLPGCCTRIFNCSGILD